jgi:hypothetical protein
MFESVAVGALLALLRARSLVRVGAARIRNIPPINSGSEPVMKTLRLERVRIRTLFQPL